MITRLAHAELAVDDLAAARAFYVDVLGFEEHLAATDALHLRAPGEFDVWSVKLTAAPSAGLIAIGLRVTEPGDLARLRDLHERLGLPTRELAAGAEPGRGAGLRVRVPGGHTVDFHHEIDEVGLYDADGAPRLPTRSTHRTHGVALQRLDHVNLRVPDFPRALAYWSGDLGFSVSEVVLDDRGDPRLAWLRRNPSTHDVALGAYDRPGFHHVAFTLADVSALGAAADLVADAGFQHAMEYGPGRHGATGASAMYLKDPAGNRIELYTGDYLRDLDRPPVRWTPEAYARKGLLWWGQEPPASFREAGAVLLAAEAAAP